MSDINEEQKRLYKRAEENDIKIIEPSEEECFVGIIKEYQRKVDELEDRINKAVEYIEKQTKGYQDDFDRVEEESWLYDLKITLNILQGGNKE